MKQTDKIIEAIRNGKNRTAEIAAATGLPVAKVRVRVSEMVRAGVLSAFRTLECPSHGNEKFYRIRG